MRAKTSLLLALAVTCGGCGVGSCRSNPPAGANQAAPATVPKRLLYLIAPDGSYAALDRDTLASVATGDLKDAQIYQIDGIVPDPQRQAIVLRTSRAWSATATEPSVGLVIVRMVREGGTPRLRLVREVPPPAVPRQFKGAMVAGGPSHLVLASWAGPDGMTTSLATNSANEPPRQAKDFALGPANCTSADGARAYALQPGRPLQIGILTVNDLSVKRGPTGLSAAASSPIFIAGASGACRALLVGRPDKPTQQRVQLPAVLYDLESQRSVQEMTVSAPSDFFLSADGSTLLADEKTLVANVLPSGATVGMKYRKTGVLRIYGTSAAKEIATARLAQDGTVSLILEPLAYYVSPKLLSVVNLTTGAVTATAAIPFTRAFVAPLDEQ